MTDGPWIKFYPADWLTGTRGLSPAETGIYVTLVAMMYEKGGAIVGDLAKLARLCNCPTGPFQKILDRLVEDGKIERSDEGALTNRRVKNELATRQKTSVAASQSAALRWGKDKEKQSADDADAMREASIAGAGQISEVRYQKLEKEESLTDRSDLFENPVGSVSTKREQTRRGTRLQSDWVLPRAWGDWAMAEYPSLSREVVLQIAAEFKDYWIGVPGSKGTKLNWEATWRNRVREKAPRANGTPSRRSPSAIAAERNQLRDRIENEHGIGCQEGDDPRYAGRVGSLEPALQGEPQRLLPRR